MVINLTEDEINIMLKTLCISTSIWNKIHDAYKPFQTAKHKLNDLNLERERLLKERDALSAILQTNKQNIEDIYIKFPELDTEQ